MVRWSPEKVDGDSPSRRAEKAAAFWALHTGPGFVLPNAWDAGSARIFEQVGFPAVATTSAGIAWSRGVPDGGTLDRDTMLEAVGRIVSAVDVPVTADLEAGYGDTADEVGRTVALAVELGAVGGNLEDARPGGLYGVDEAVDRVGSGPSGGACGHVRAQRPDRHLLRRGGRRPVRRDRRAGHEVRRGGCDLHLRPGRRRGGHDPAARSGDPCPAQRGRRPRERHRRAHPLRAGRPADQPRRGPGPGLARPARAGRPGACSTPARSGSSTARSGTPNCSDASAPEPARGRRARGLPRPGPPELLGG